LVTNTIPDTKEHHFFHDSFCKRTEININSTRKTDEYVHEKDTNPKLIEHDHEFTIRMLEQSRARVHVVYGGRSRKLFENKYKIKAAKGVAKYRIVEKTIAGVEVRCYYLLTFCVSILLT
jgi:hypothetical protein